MDEAVDKDATLPELFIQCGTEDFLYDDNQRFMKYLDEKGINYKYEEDLGNMIMLLGQSHCTYH